MQQKIKWKVICSGSIREGFDKQQVVENLSQLNITADQAQKLVSGAPVTVKKDLDQVVAFRLKSHLKKFGLEVSLERMPRKITPSINALSLEPLTGEEDDSVENQVADSRLSSNEMECPKCKAVQPRAEECAHCGIIISRYLQRHNPNSEDSVVDNEDDDPLDYQDFSEGVNLGQAAMVAAAFGLFFIIKALFFNNANYQPIGSSPEARAQIEAVLAAVKIESPSPRKIKRLLEEHRYSEVESILRGLDNKTSRDILWEEPYQKVIDSFSPKNDFRLETLSSWVKERHSVWAYLARGSYYTHAAGLARGTRFARDTSEAQFSSYRGLQGKAYQDLLKARDKDRDIMPIYTLLLVVADTQGGDISNEAILDDAISANPAGYFYRYQYLRSIMPKWGGSYKQMDDFVEATSQYYSLNPRLNLLRGFAKGEKANSAMWNKNYNACVSLYSEALQFGANAKWLRYRAHCLSKIKEYDRAMEDVTLSLEIYPDDFAKQLQSWLSTKT